MLKKPENPVDYPLPGEPLGALQERLLVKRELARRARESNEKAAEVTQEPDQTESNK